MKIALQFISRPPRRPARTAQEKAIQKAFKNIGRESKKLANREVVRPLRALMKRRTDFTYENPLLYPQFVTKKFRKLLQARRTFRGNKFEKTGTGYQQWILRIKVWTSLSNILFHRKTARPLKLPFNKYDELMKRGINQIALKELRQHLDPVARAEMAHAIHKGLSGK